MESENESEDNDLEFTTVFSKKKRMSPAKRRKVFDSLEGDEIVVIKYYNDKRDICYFTGHVYSKFHDWLTDEWSIILKHPKTLTGKVYEDTVFVDLPDILRITVIGKDPTNKPFRKVESSENDSEETTSEITKPHTGQVARLTQQFENGTKKPAQERQQSPDEDQPKPDSYTKIIGITQGSKTSPKQFLQSFVILPTVENHC